MCKYFIHLAGGPVTEKNYCVGHSLKLRNIGMGHDSRLCVWWVVESFEIYVYFRRTE